MKNIILILTLVFLSTFAFGSNLKFAEELLADGDYYRALTILKEIEFANRGTKIGFESQKMILQVHIKAKDFENFDSNVSKLLIHYSRFAESLKKEVAEAESSFLIGNYAHAYNLINSTPALPEKKYYFGSFLDRNPENACFTENCKAVEKVEAEINSAKYAKNESLALVLGIIPGMGQVYAGNTSSGIGSFLLTSFFAGVSIIAFNNDETAMGVASSAVGGTFYLASIYAGYETARRHNIVKTSEARKKLYDIPVEIDLIKIIWD